MDLLNLSDVIFGERGHTPNMDSRCTYDRAMKETILAPRSWLSSWAWPRGADGRLCHAVAYTEWSVGRRNPFLEVRSQKAISLNSMHLEGMDEEAEIMIRRCDDHEFDVISEIINDGSQVYRGIIPADRWTEPYMPSDELRHEIDDGIMFWGYEENGTLGGVMGIQHVHDVTLIRHAYVRSINQSRGLERAFCLTCER